MDWTLLGLEMSLRHDLHFVKMSLRKLSKLRDPRVQLGKYGECWLALQAWCWFRASKFYNMYGLGFAWTWNVSSSRPSFCQKQAIQASKTKNQDGECNLASMANVGWRSKPDADSNVGWRSSIKHQSFTACMGWALLGLEMSLRHDLHFVKSKLSKLWKPRVQLGKYGECWLALQAWCWFIASASKCFRHDLHFVKSMYGLGFAWTWNVSSSRPSFCQRQAIQASRSKSATWQVWRMLVGAPSLMLIHSIKVLQHVWVGLCLDLKCLFVTTFILSKASYPSFKNQDCNLASMANVGWRSKPDADDSACSIKMFSSHLHCVMYGLGFAWTWNVSSSRPSFCQRQAIQASRTKSATWQVWRMLVGAPSLMLIHSIKVLQHVWVGLCLDLKCLFVTTFILSKASYPSFEIQECNLASMANVGWRSKPDADSEHQSFTTCMGWALLGLEMSLRHDLHFVKSKLSKLQKPRVQLGKYGECWLALQAWCWFIASKFYSMYGLGFAWTWNVSSSRPSFCQKQAIQASKTKSATWQVWRMLVGAPSLMLIHSIKVLHTCMGWALLGLEMSLRHDLHFVKGKLSKLREPRVQLGKYGECWLALQAWCWFTASKFYSMYGLGFAWTWNVSSSRPSFCQKASYPSFENQECNLASMANVGWRSKPDADS